MERCDFASIMAIVRKYLVDGYFESQPDFLFVLFGDYVKKRDAYFESAAVNRWLNGLVPVNSDIGMFYHESEENRAKLAKTLETEIFPCMSDKAMAVREVSELLTWGENVSEEKKAGLLGLLPDEAAFLANVIVFGMTCTFVKRDIRKPSLPPANLSPVLSGYVVDEGLPNPCRHFCGRDAELDALHAMLTEKEKVFLCGIPGIGKSELAKAYAKVHKKDYTNILYLTYSGDLKRDIANLIFSDDGSRENDDERFRRHNRFLRTLKTDTLLIIDNFNAAISGDGILSVVLKYDCRILFTTRNNPPERDCFILEEIADRDALFGMCAKLYADAEENRAVLEEIIETVHSHTLAVELAARLLETGLLEPREVLEKLRAERASFDAADKINVSKDGKRSRATYYDHIHTLFALFSLTVPQREIMRSLSLIPPSGIPAKLFGKWMGFTDLNDVNEMTELGFISPQPGRKIVLHPMMKDVSVSEFPPSFSACHTLLESLRKVCKAYTDAIPYSAMLFQIVENAVDLAEKDDLSFYLSLLESAFECMEKFRYDSGMQRLLKEMGRLLKNESLATLYHRTLLKSFRAKAEKKRENAVRLMKEAIALIPEINEETAELAATLNLNLANLYMRWQKPKLFKQHMLAGTAIMEKYNLMGQSKGWTQALTIVAFINDPETFEIAIVVLLELERILYKRNGKDSVALKDLGGVLKAMAYMHMAAGHKEDAALTFRKAMYVYSLLYANDPASLESEKKQIADICESRALTGVFPLAART